MRVTTDADTGLPWFILAIDLAPLLVAGFMWLMFRKLRRAGRPDRAAEIVIGSGAAYAVGNLAVHLTLDHPPGWLRYLFLIPWVLTCFGFAAYRLRNHLHRRTDPH